MRFFRPRQSFSLDYTPKQWVGVCNSILLFLVAVMCGTVIYEIYNLDQRFVNIVDSSISIRDLVSLAKINSIKTPYWRNATSSISIYSAFYSKINTHDNVILLISSISSYDIRFKNLRCLIKYDEEEELTVTYVQHQFITNCTMLFMYCLTKSEKIPKKVAIVSYTSNMPVPWISIEKIPPKMDSSSGPPRIAACVKPLTKSISVKEIADFVAFYEIIGINHFYFYDHSLSHDSVAFLRQLVATGHSINLLPWNKDKEFHHCQVSWSEYVQDCLHRATNRYNYIFTTDIFDYFVPTRYFRLIDLFDNTKKSALNLKLKKANFCNLFRSNNQSTENDSVRNMVFRGEYYISNTNFILRPELTSAIHFYESFEVNNDETNSFTVLTEYDGAVRHLTRKCDANANLDTGVIKYINALDRSLVMEAYKHTPGGNVQLTAATETM